MKAWVQSLSSNQYRVLHHLCNFGSFALALVFLWAVKSYLAWGIIFAFQIVSCHLLSKWRYACKSCDKKFCGEHFGQ